MPQGNPGKNDFSKGAVWKNIMSLAVPLTVAQLVAHDHTAGVQSGYKSLEYDNNGVPHCDLGTSGVTGSSASHTHSLSGVKSGSASSLPPYYTLAYIMRVA